MSKPSFLCKNTQVIMNTFLQLRDSLRSQLTRSAIEKKIRKVLHKTAVKTTTLTKNFSLSQKHRGNYDCTTRIVEDGIRKLHQMLIQSCYNEWIHLVPTCRLHINVKKHEVRCFDLTNTHITEIIDREVIVIVMVWFRNIKNKEDLLIYRHPFNHLSHCSLLFNTGPYGYTHRSIHKSLSKL